MRAASSVAIADLLASGLRPEPHEAVAIALEVCRQVMRQGPRAGVAAPISAATVAIDAAGAVVAAGGPPVEDDQTVLLVGHLLLEMLGPPNTAAGARVPARLRAVAIRACSAQPGSYSSVASLSSALRRFGAVKGFAAIRAVFERWQLSSSGRVQIPTGLGTAAAPGRFDRGLHPANWSGADTDRDSTDPLPPLVPAGHEELSNPTPPNARRSTWLTTALVAGVTMLLLAGGVLFWFADVDLPMPLQRPSARPVPASPPPGRELLTRPGRAPAKAVKVNAAGRSDVVRAPVEPAQPERRP
jgi:hypothetical protein